MHVNDMHVVWYRLHDVISVWSISTNHSNNYRNFLPYYVHSLCTSEIKLILSRYKENCWQYRISHCSGLPLPLILVWVKFKERNTGSVTTRDRNYSKRNFYLTAERVTLYTISPKRELKCLQYKKH